MAQGDPPEDIAMRHPRAVSMIAGMIYTLIATAIVGLWRGPEAFQFSSGENPTRVCSSWGMLGSVWSQTTIATFFDATNVLHSVAIPLWAPTERRQALS